MLPFMHVCLAKCVKRGSSARPRLVWTASKAPSNVRLNQAAAHSSDPPPELYRATPPRDFRAVRRFEKSRRIRNGQRPQATWHERRRMCGNAIFPTKTLVEQLRARQDPITAETGTEEQVLATSTSHRNNVFALQVLLNKSESKLKDPVEWQNRVNTFLLRGIQEEDVNDWISILEAEDADTKVDRLVSSTRFIPIFVLMAVIRTDERMIKGSALVKLYDYIARTYIAQSSQAKREWKEELDSGLRLMTQNNYANMTHDHFKLLISRLVHHCVHTFPASLPMIAHLVVDFMRGMNDSPPKRGGQNSGYARRCLLFNHTLVNFRRTPPTNGLAALSYNWKAIKILLAYSASHARPCIITRYGYRAIRMVLMGLKKTEEDKLTASRHARTWPPYIRQLDGTDEARPKEAYYSRSVKAGILKQSEGFSHDLTDFAMDRLGGSLPSESISIQTRSVGTALWQSQHTSQAILTYWAAKVRATRNSHEAWQIFHRPPLSDLTPDLQVYAEMFEKLYARDAQPDSSSLPGDGKETYPPHLANLTELERERVSPCSPSELYERMIQSGLRPANKCLSILVRHAPSIGSARRYLGDSLLPSTAVENMIDAPVPETKHLAQIPMGIFDAYLSLLCRQQGRKRWQSKGNQPLHPVAQYRYSHLDRAMLLVCTRLGPRRLPAAAAPWHTVMRAVAHDSLVVQPNVGWAEDDVGTLEAMMHLYDAYVQAHGAHPVPFDALCRCVLKVLRHKLPTLHAQDDGQYHRNARRTQTIRDARRLTTAAFATLKAAFATLIHPVDAPRDARLAAAAADALPPLYWELSASNIRTYLEVLARFGAVDEGVCVMDWVLATCDPDRRSSNDKEQQQRGDPAAIFAKARDPAHKQWAMMREATVCFRSIVEAYDIDPAVVARIEARFKEMGAQGAGGWGWPSKDDVQVYDQWLFDSQVVSEK